MEKKKRTYPKWSRIKDRKTSGSINNCSLGELHFYIAQNKLQTSEFIISVKNRSGIAYTSYRFPYSEKGYQQAIELYERMINDYLDAMEREFYEENSDE